MIALALTAVTLPAANASAQWRPVVAACTSSTALAGCATLTQFQNAWDVAVTPDGKSAYATAWSSSTVRVFDRAVDEFELADVAHAAHGYWLLTRKT